MSSLHDSISNWSIFEELAFGLFSLASIEKQLRRTATDGDGWRKNAGNLRSWATMSSTKASNTLTLSA